MKDVARVGAALLALTIIARDFAVAGDSVAMRGATYLLAFVLVAALALWSDGVVTVSALGLVGHYVAALGFGHVQVDFAAPVMAGLVVAYLDLADLAIALPGDHRVDRAFALATLRRVGTVVGLGALAGAVAFGVASVRVPGGVIRALGVGGVVLVALAPISLARSQ